MISFELDIRPTLFYFPSVTQNHPISYPIIINLKKKWKGEKNTRKGNPEVTVNTRNDYNLLNILNILSMIVTSQLWHTVHGSL